MRSSLLTLLISGALMCAASLAAHAQPSAVGLWEQIDESSGKAESWFRITERNGVYEGAIVKIFLRPGDDPNWVCDKCEGADRGKPVLGLTLIKGMRRNGLEYEGGSITDPRDGSVYRAMMRVSPDGQQLEVRGYLGISLFGRSQTWRRLPDNALPAQPPAPPAPRAPARR
jgi:uncharacterized protein (DUF2147 family)